MAVASRRSFIIRNTAAELVRHLPQKDWLNEIKIVHEFVRDNIRYVRDIVGRETVQTPENTLRFGYGDCDDKALLTAALLEAIGHPARFIAVGRRPGDFEHVLVQTKIRDKWVSVETTEPVPLGWHPPSMPYQLIYHIPGAARYATRKI